MKDEEHILDEQRLAAWPSAEPPPGFADAVLTARRAQTAAEPRRWRRGFAIATTAALVAAAAALFFALRPATPAQVGSLVATQRREIAIGARAVAVVEADAAVAWQVNGDEARVEQTRGDVFYRVERGGRFVVATAAGDVIVKGTCFRVEVMDMKVGKQAFGGAAVGAMVTAAVLVTVYEGRVQIANAKGTTEIRAGERATAGGGEAPGPAVLVRSARPAGGPAIAVAEAPPPSADATREQLLARDTAQRKEIAELRSRMAALESQVNPDKRISESKSFVKPTKDELLEMAKSCTLQFDSPPLSMEPMPISPRLTERLGLTADELVAIGRANQDVTQRTLAQLRAIYAEVTGNAAAAEDMTGMTLMAEIQEKTGRDEGNEARRLLAQERAGLVPPPSSLVGRPPAERALRIMSSVGDELQHELAKALGPEKADALRSANDGWPAHSKISGCGRSGDDDGTDVQTTPERAR